MFVLEGMGVIGYYICSFCITVVLLGGVIRVFRFFGVYLSFLFVFYL